MFDMSGDWKLVQAARNSRVRSCITTSLPCLLLMILHRPAHGRIMHIEMLRDRQHGMLPGKICSRHRFIAWIVLLELRQGLRQCPALRAGNFIQWSLAFDERLHLLHKGFRAQVDLSLQLRPDTRQARAFMDEGDVFGNGTGTTPPKLPEYPVRLQPWRRRRLSAGCRVAAPWPGLQTPDHLRPQGIEHHIARQLQQITVPFDQRIEIAKSGSKSRNRGQVLHEIAHEIGVRSCITTSSPCHSLAFTVTYRPAHIRKQRGGIHASPGSAVGVVFEQGGERHGRSGQVSVFGKVSSPPNTSRLSPPPLAAHRPITLPSSLSIQRQGLSSRPGWS